MERLWKLSTKVDHMSKRIHKYVSMVAAISERYNETGEAHNWRDAGVWRWPHKNVSWIWHVCHQTHVARVIYSSLNQTTCIKPWLALYSVIYKSVRLNCFTLLSIKTGIITVQAFLLWKIAHWRELFLGVLRGRTWKLCNQSRNIIKLATQGSQRLSLGILESSKKLESNCCLKMLRPFRWKWSSEGRRRCSCPEPTTKQSWVPLSGKEALQADTYFYFLTALLWYIGQLIKCTYLKCKIW